MVAVVAMLCSLLAGSRVLNPTARKYSGTCDLDGATAATLTYSTDGQYGPRQPVDDTDTVTVFFSRNGTDFVQVDQIGSDDVGSPPARLT